MLPSRSVLKCRQIFVWSEPVPAKAQVLVLPQEWGFSAFSQMIFCPRSRGFAAIFCPGVGISPLKNSPGVCRGDVNSWNWLMHQTSVVSLWPREDPEAVQLREDVPSNDCQLTFYQWNLCNSRFHWLIRNQTCCASHWYLYRSQAMLFCLSYGMHWANAVVNWNFGSTENIQELKMRYLVYVFSVNSCSEVIIDFVVFITTIK